MKIEQFKKAAKRYSVSANLPLNQAQEQMATFFGFKNFDAARKSLEPKREASPPEPAHEWISSATADAIIKRIKSLAEPLSEDNKFGLERRERAFDLLDGVVTALCFLRKTRTKILTTELLIEYLALDKIEELYLIGHNEFKSSGALPQEFAKVKKYLDEELPRYQVSKLFINDSTVDVNTTRVPEGPKNFEAMQDASAYEHHALCCKWLIHPIFSLLKIEEDERQCEKGMYPIPFSA